MSDYNADARSAVAKLSSRRHSTSLGRPVPVPRARQVQLALVVPITLLIVCFLILF